MGKSVTGHILTQRKFDLALLRIANQQVSAATFQDFADVQATQAALAAQLATTTEQLRDAEAILVGVDSTPGALLRKMVEDHFAKWQRRS
jgi:hypothetical protein